jgi:hypothetical protein
MYIYLVIICPSVTFNNNNIIINTNKSNNNNTTFPYDLTGNRKRSAAISQNSRQASCGKSPSCKSSDRKASSSKKGYARDDERSTEETSVSISVNRSSIYSVDRIIDSTIILSQSQLSNQFNSNVIVSIQGKDTSTTNTSNTTNSQTSELASEVGITVAMKPSTSTTTLNLNATTNKHYHLPKHNFKTSLMRIDSFIDDTSERHKSIRQALGLRNHSRIHIDSAASPNSNTVTNSL